MPVGVYRLLRHPITEGVFPEKVALNPLRLVEDRVRPSTGDGAMSHVDLM